VPIWPSLNRLATRTGHSRPIQRAMAILRSAITNFELTMAEHTVSFNKKNEKKIFWGGRSRSIEQRGADTEHGGVVVESVCRELPGQHFRRLRRSPPLYLPAPQSVSPPYGRSHVSGVSRRRSSTSSNWRPIHCNTLPRVWVNSLLTLSQNAHSNDPNRPLLTRPGWVKRTLGCRAYPIR